MLMETNLIPDSYSWVSIDSATKQLVSAACQRKPKTTIALYTQGHAHHCRFMKDVSSSHKGDNVTNLNLKVIE